MRIEVGRAMCGTDVEQRGSEDRTEGRRAGDDDGEGCLDKGEIRARRGVARRDVAFFRHDADADARGGGGDDDKGEREDHREAPLVGTIELEAPHAGGREGGRGEVADDVPRGIFDDFGELVATVARVTLVVGMPDFRERVAAEHTG